jgi:hypothetical protein
MSISHVANFEKPAISPLFCIFLELVEGRCLRDEYCVFSKVRSYLCYLCAFVLPSLFWDLCQRYYEVYQWVVLCDAGSWTDRVFVSWTLAYRRMKVI